MQEVPDVQVSLVSSAFIPLPLPATRGSVPQGRLD